MTTRIVVSRHEGNVFVDVGILDRAGSLHVVPALRPEERAIDANRYIEVTPHGLLGIRLEVRRLRDRRVVGSATFPSRLLAVEV